MNNPPRRAVIVGLGLLGASLALALRRRLPGIRIAGVSSPATIAKAKAAGLVDEGYGYEELFRAAEGADLAVLCTPIFHILELLRQWEAAPPPFADGCMVTDVGSTKRGICEAGRRAFARAGGPVFIGSHPMAGSEENGIDARDEHLFENATWVLCPGPDGAAAAPRLEALVALLGARPLVMAAGLHDEVVAHVSHLPQLLSTALAGSLARQAALREQGLQVAGGGFRDMTRLAGSSWPVWEPIFASNQAPVAAALDAFLSHLGEMRSALGGNGIAPALGTLFAEGHELRQAFHARKKGYAPGITELILHIPDRPGTLVAVLQPLAALGVNVIDVDILNVREGEGGVLLLAFRTRADAQRALACLAPLGFDGEIR